MVFIIRSLKIFVSWVTRVSRIYVKLGLSNYEGVGVDSDPFVTVTQIWRVPWHNTFLR